MPLRSHTFEVQPYGDELAALEHAFEWLMALAKVIGTRRDSQKASVAAEPSRLMAVSEGKDEFGLPCEGVEACLREAVEARSLASRQAGSPTSLDRLTDAYQLGEPERLALLLAAVGAFSTTRHEDIVEASGLNWSFLAPCPEFIAAMMLDDSLALRVEIRRVLGPHGTLAREGLMDSTFCEDDLPAEFWQQANLRLTSKGLALLNGESEIRGEMQCPLCGSPTRAMQGA